jgi:hypothetical protein
MVLGELVVAQAQAASTLLEQEELVMEEVLDQVAVVEGLWKRQFQAYLEMTIPFSLKYLKHLSCVMDKLMEATMRIQKPSARLSISVLMMEMEEEQSTASFALMGQYSSSNTLCVIGGSMLTVHLLSLCIL